MPEEKARILVADDGKVMRLVLTRKLKESGYEVADVASGREALDLIAKEPFDLVVLDVMMPDVDGLEALKTLRRTHSQVQLPIIMATANDEDEDIVRAFDLGASDFVSKPINFPVLNARIQTHLKLKRAMEELEKRG